MLSTTVAVIFLLMFVFSSTTSIMIRRLDLMCVNLDNLENKKGEDRVGFLFFFIVQSSFSILFFQFYFISIRKNMCFNPSLSSTFLHIFLPWHIQEQCAAWRWGAPSPSRSWLHSFMLAGYALLLPSLFRFFSYSLSLSLSLSLFFLSLSRFLFLSLCT